MGHSVYTIPTFGDGVFIWRCVVIIGTWAKFFCENWIQEKLDAGIFTHWIPL